VASRNAGWWTIARRRGVPVRLHWSILLTPLAVTGFHFEGVASAAVVALLLAHTLGHLVAAVVLRLEIASVDATGVGGSCRILGAVTPFERSAVAWAGIAMQLAILAVVGALVSVLGFPTAPTASAIARMAIGPNVALILLNLAPIPPLDGAEAWLVVTRWRDRHVRPRSGYTRWHGPARREGDLEN
jgi:Zn-dependent protease